MNINEIMSYLIIIFIAFGAFIIINALNRPEPCPQVIEKTHRPSLCAQYYEEEGDAWNDCMGVGRK